MNTNQYTQNNCLSLTPRQVSWVVSAFLLLSFFIFIAGYFLGQQRAITDFGGKIEQESLADAISASLYSRGDIKGNNNDQADEEMQVEPVSKTVDGDLLEKEAVQPGSESRHEQVGHTSELATSVVQPEVLEKTDIVAADSRRYYAELIGFGTEQAAQAFVKRVKKSGIVVVSKKRLSKTARGKKIVWYQVVTEPYADQTALRDVVALLEKKEHLNGVSIQAC